MFDRQITFTRLTFTITQARGTKFWWLWAIWHWWIGWCVTDGNLRYINVFNVITDHPIGTRKVSIAIYKLPSLIILVKREYTWNVNCWYDFKRWLFAIAMHSNFSPKHTLFINQKIEEKWKFYSPKTLHFFSASILYMAIQEYAHTEHILLIAILSHTMCSQSYRTNPKHSWHFAQTTSESKWKERESLTAGFHCLILRYW